MTTKRTKMTKKVSIDLSDAQCLEIGKQQADKELRYAQLETKAKEVAGDYRTQLAKLWIEIQGLATEQKEKKRFEEVEVVEIPDPERSLVKICRADDERQILETRQMTLNEIQEAKQRTFAERQATLEIPQDGGKIVQVRRGKKSDDSSGKPENIDA